MQNSSIIKSALICSLLLFVFACTFSSVIFADNEFANGNEVNSALSEFDESFNSFEGDTVTKAEFIYVLLESLGYSDFLKEFPFDKAAEVGLINKLDFSTPNLTRAELGSIISAYKSIKSGFGTVAEVLSVTSYYDPTVSTNSISVYNASSNISSFVTDRKFSVCLSQGKGSYFADIVRFDMPLYTYTSGYFTAFGLSGEEARLDIGVKFDISSGYTVKSDSSDIDSTFCDGILSVKISKPQTVSVVFDDSIGTTITVFIVEGILDSADASSLFGDKVDYVSSISQDASEACPIKISIDGTAIYADAFIKNGKAYIESSLFGGEYNGECHRKNGIRYLPIEAFSELGYKEISYDSKSGAITIFQKASDLVYETAEYLAVDGTDIKLYGDKFNVSSSEKAEIFTEIPSNIILFDSVYLKTYASADPGSCLTYSVVGISATREREVLSSFNVYYGGKEKLSDGYFDLSGADGFYEELYLTVSSANGCNFTIDSCWLSDESFDLGDNEFNPFG